MSKFSDCRSVEYFSSEIPAVLIISQDTNRTHLWVDVAMTWASRASDCDWSSAEILLSRGVIMFVGECERASRLKSVAPATC